MTYIVATRSAIDHIVIDGRSSFELPWKKHRQNGLMELRLGDSRKDGSSKRPSAMTTTAHDLAGVRERVEAMAADEDERAEYIWHVIEGAPENRPPRWAEEMRLNMDAARQRAADIRALLAATEALEVGEGMVVVPREPTEAMLKASWDQTAAATPAERMANELCDTKTAHMHKMRRRYRAMISAINRESQDE